MENYVQESPLLKPHESTVVDRNLQEKIIKSLFCTSIHSKTPTRVSPRAEIPRHRRVPKRVTAVRLPSAASLSDLRESFLPATRQGRNLVKASEADT